MSESVLALFEQRVNQQSHKQALRVRTDKGWVGYSWRQWWESAERVCAGLVALGLAPGARVAILSRTRAEWAWADMGVMMAQAISVPVYVAQLPAQIIEILRHSGSSALIVEDPAMLQALVEEDEAFITALHVIYLEASIYAPIKTGEGLVREDEVSLHRASGRLVTVEPLRASWAKEGARGAQLWSWAQLEAQGRRALAADSKVAALRRRGVGPAQIATIVYTSGTSGQPRGVILTHENVIAELEAITRKGLFNASDLQLLSLPLAHIFARVVYWATLCYGMELAFAERISTVLRDAREVEPTVMAVVPQMLVSIAQGLEQRVAQMSSARGGLYKRLFAQGLRRSKAQQRLMRSAADDVSPEPDVSSAAPAGLLSRGVDVLLEHTLLTRVRAVFGGKLRVIISGGAPMDVGVMETLHACGLQVLEGYGLTETCAAISLNLPQAFCFGSVGRPLPGVDVTIDLDGEILVRGQMVMSGYWGDDEATARAFDARGWFHTGDLGRFDEQGYLYVTGRKKELIVTAGGKNVAPLVIERRLEASPLIEHAILFGDGRPYLVALLSLAQGPVRDWAKARGLGAGMSWEDLLKQDALRRAIGEHISSSNAQGPSYEAVRKFAFLPQLLGVDDGLLTPTLKVRRAQVGRRYAALLEALYQQLEPASVHLTK